MQVVITILLCFIITLGLFIAYAGLGSRHHSHNAYDVDTLYRDRFWNYPFRHYFDNNNSHMYHNNHHMHHGTGSGHTQNHGTQIVFTAPTATPHVPPPPPTAPHVSTPPASGGLALPQVGSGSQREGAIDMSAIFGGLNMPFPSASAPAPAPASSNAEGPSINTDAGTPSLVTPSLDSATSDVVETNVQGFTPQSYASNCGTYSCAE